MTFPQLKKKKANHTVIIGCGSLGANLANLISEENGKVVVLDRSELAFRRLSSSFAGLSVVGNGMDLDVLQDIGIDEADKLVIVTDNDNVNIMIALLAREMYGVKNVVAQLYDPECAYDYQAFGIETICPAMFTAQMIDNMLEKQAEALEA